MLSDWSTFSHDLLCFKKYKSCLPDSSSRSLLVILMFPLLIESLSRGVNGISTTVALSHCFLAEIPNSTIPLTSFSEGLWSILFVPQRLKIYQIPKLFLKFCILLNTCWILSPGIPKFKLLWLEKYFFQISGYLPKLEIIGSPVSNIFDNDWFSKQFCSLNLLYQPTFTSSWSWNKM